MRTRSNGMRRAHGAVRTIEQDRDEITMFVGTLDGQTLDEALANLADDATRCGWSRQAVREAASAIRVRATKNGGVL